jgi:8-oxo-dGTP pyrophosphatase MutT (NUDIX family)
MTNLDGLVRDYVRQFPEESQSLSRLHEQLGDGASLIDRRNFRGHATASGLVVKDGSVLLIHHKGLGRYLQPGGHHEAAETSVACALREVQEETGVQIALHPWHGEHGGIPIHIDTHPIPANERKGEAAHFHHDFMYLFILQSDVQMRPQESEVSDCRWFPLTTEFEDRGLAVAARKAAGVCAAR